IPLEKLHLSIRQSHHKRLHLFKILQGKYMTKLIRNSTAEFLIFTNQTGDQSIEVRYEDNEIWLT
ncbi:hypothetical protein ACWIXK_10675, partial [Ursidibacter sp. B-7004-1]